jgi:hypothetical protein
MATQVHRTAQLCRFKRKRTSKPEFGILIDEDRIIIDVEGKPIMDTVWSFTPLPDHGYAVFCHWTDKPVKDEHLKGGHRGKAQVR